MKVFNAIKAGEEVSNGKLVERTSFSASSVRIYLKELVAQGKVKKTGEKKATRYSLEAKNEDEE